MKISVIGSGVYGLAMTNLLCSNGCDVTLWTEKNPDEISAPNGVKVTNSFEDAINSAKLVYVLTGSKFTPSIFEGISPFLKEDMVVLLGSKGILEDTSLITEKFEEILPKTKYAVISGPTFAKDIGALEPVGFTIATKNYEDYLTIKQAMKSVFLEYTNDIIGTEISGSLKNAYAIGSGILGGFNYGPSVRSLYITRVIEEMKSIFESLGAQKDTILTLASIGDLILTCTSEDSRNFTFGTILSSKDSKEKDEYLKNNTVEGYENLKVYVKLFNQKNIESPILNTVNSIVSGKEKPETLIDLLLK
jgi:glycerol-3-phosphate dehydrogenase (NAD(P)+)